MKMGIQEEITEHDAHRDVKPDNLVVDKSFNLKIIDFDIAMLVEDEDEEVDDQCETRDWMAPESLLDRFGKEDASLRVFAKDLTAHDPKQWPSMLEWGRYSALPFSHAGNMGNSDARKASRPRRDRVDGDGEDTKPPNVKKLRLKSGQCNMGGFRDCYGLGIKVEAH
ncbi:hypothetical protein L210DRAFT_3647381 [Boletus edulis BED1]|uniref:Protein kinase domain-containing protein n=1 Tax=Boletus edulis BED1 TaxID=1328754 RepID=A0AAD4GD21_BOLED|nr:hypothetical protein L210DRAFT_3647381 [Boletus edulis BED1]